MNVTENIIAIAIKMVETSLYPPQINSIESAFRLHPETYRFNIRNIPNGEGYIVKFLENRCALFIKNTPAPDDLFYGGLWGIANRFKQPDYQFIVRMVANPNPVEEPGSAFQVKWGLDIDELDSVH